MNVKSFRFFNQSADIGLRFTDDLRRLQKKLIAAVAPFTEKSGRAAAFVTTIEEPDIIQLTIDYISTFVPDGTDKKFNPHVTIGMLSTSAPKTSGCFCWLFHGFGLSAANKALFESRMAEANAKLLPAFQKVTRGFGAEGVPIHYPLTSDQCHGNSEHFQWFVENEKASRKTSLPDLSSDDITLRRF